MRSTIARQPYSPATKVVAPQGSSTKADYYTDGVNDDVQIQAAITALGSGGGRIVLHKGSYDIGTTITISNDISIHGMGWETVLTAKTALNNYIFTFSPSAPGIKADISHMKLNCNAANQTTGGGGIYAAGAVQSLFNHLWITAPFNESLYLYQIDTGVFGHHNRVINSLFDGGNASSGTGLAIKIAASDENYIHNCDFENNGGSTNTADGNVHHIYDLAGLNKIDSCVFVGGKEGIRLSNASNNVISNNIFDTLTNNILYIKGSRHNIIGNYFYGLTGASDNTYVSVRLESGDSNNIVGNMFKSASSANKTKYFIEDTSTGHNNISSNQFVIDGALGSGKMYAATTVPNEVSANVGLTPNDETKTYYMKNTSGGALAAGDVVILKSVAAGDEVTTTTSQGDDKIFGMAVESINDTAYGYIQTLGKTVSLKVNGTTDIAVGDLIGTYTTAKIAMKAASGDMAFAIALEAYTTDDSSGVIDALLITPRKI